jgi:3-oxoacyl-[acyl-carrier-protein] synthase II
MQYGLMGPNYAVTSACASSNHALGDALRIMRYGDADVMICGGAEATITPVGLGGFCAARALSQRNDEPQKASRPFDKNRDGFVMGEGSAMFVLETLEHAKSRGAKIYAELAGYAATDDAFHITAPREDGVTQSLCMKKALEDAGVNLDDVDYINAHGTSTEFNDKFETLAIKLTFGEKAYKIPVSSTKSMTGHLLGAAGAAELAAILLCIENKFIHPTINYETPDPDCDLDYVPNVAREKEIKVAISNNFGFGGHNAVIVVKKFE